MNLTALGNLGNAVWGNSKLIRGGLAWGSLGIAGALLLRGMAVPDWYVAILASNMAYYFGTRGVQDTPGTPPATPAPPTGQAGP